MYHSIYSRIHGFVGLLVLAYAPMAYFLVGMYREISQPMTDDEVRSVNRIISAYTFLCSVIAYVFIGYGMWFAFSGNPEEQEFAKKLLREALT